MLDCTDDSSPARASGRSARKRRAVERQGPAVPFRAWSQREVMAAEEESQGLSWHRIVAWALTVALHIAALLHLTIPPLARTPGTTAGTQGAAAAANTPSARLQVVVVQASAAGDAGTVAGEAPGGPRSAAAASARSPPQSRRQAPPPAPAIPAPNEMLRMPAPAGARTVADQPQSTAAATPVARLFRADGAPALPTATIDDLKAADNDARNFDYMTPGLAGAEAAFRRPPAIAYTPTRLDADWKPVRTLGGDVMHAISEKLTYQNERKSFRCSLVPPICSWGRVDPAVELDDPHTLNPDENAQCGSLLDAIVGATNQVEWMKLRKRYDAQCRKPPERTRLPPDDPAAAAARVSMQP
jgi:hypothetical protein